MIRGSVHQYFVSAMECGPRAGQISTEHLKTSTQQFFRDLSATPFTRLHKFRRCSRNRHTFFGPWETQSVFIYLNHFFLKRKLRSQKAVSEKDQIGGCFGLDFFLFPSPPPLPLCVGKWRDLELKLSQRTPPIPRPPPRAISGAKWTMRPTESDLLSPTHPPLPTLPRLHKFWRCYQKRHTFFWTAGNNLCLYQNHFYFLEKNFHNLTVSIECREFDRCFGLDCFEKLFEKLW
jgi:hypothetical protein